MSVRYKKRDRFANPLEYRSSLGYAWIVSSVRLSGVLFIAYPQDHMPRHVHAFAEETEVIVDLRKARTVALADRSDAIRPGNAKRSSVRHILETAAEHFDELVQLWEKMHE